MPYKIIINKNVEPRLVEVPDKPRSECGGKGFNCCPNERCVFLVHTDKVTALLADESKHIAFKDVEQAKRIINPCDCLKGKSLCFMPCGHSYDGWPSKHIDQTFDLPENIGVSFEKTCDGSIYGCDKNRCRDCADHAKSWTKLAILTPESEPSSKQGEKIEAIEFAQFLLNDFDMSCLDGGQTLCWQSCGTNQKYTTQEIYKEFCSTKK